jgi:hypothetical protein
LSRRWLACGLLAIGLSTMALPAAGLVKFDFEQKYYVHPQRQVWDFCLIRSSDVYHIFYHSIHENTPGAVHGDTIWHATSTDLFHWTSPEVAITVGPGWWEAEAIWAPDVIWDPERKSWVMLYTGVDSLKVQRTCVAHSTNLTNWFKNPHNPVFEPDSLTYYWSPTVEWSSFRDPFIFFEGGLWHMLSTANLRENGYPGFKRGIIHHATSTALVDWSDAGPFFIHNGAQYTHELESSQYHVRQGWHHLFFSETDIPGTSHLVSDTQGGWDMADWQLLERGGAPEIDEFDPGVTIFSRYGRDRHNHNNKLFYVVRFDTMVFDDGGQTPQILKPHPLARKWVSFDGPATIANPTFGDNTFERGEPTCGLEGNGWFGSQEFYQGPLSDTGTPGDRLGDSATGTLISHDFEITGDYIQLKVGGGYYPNTCYVALVDANTDAILLKETGHGSDTMVWRIWDVRRYQGTKVYITIVDQEQSEFGHINVDEIEEVVDIVTAVQNPPSAALIDHGPRPNPSNPATEIRFSLDGPARYLVCIHDLRGGLIWRSPETAAQAGPHAVLWRGTRDDGLPAAAGVYLYSIQINGKLAGSGKLSLIK